jgi:predicted transposase/invertase (TIGR01784 family)
VGILNFVFKDDVYTDADGNITDAVIKEESDDEFRHDVMLVDVNNDNKVFYHKLGFVYLEMPKFRKTIEQCKSFYDKWMFVLRNLSSLMERPKELQERIFKKVFEQAEIARYTPEEHFAYEESLKNMRDIDSVITSAEREGVRRGRAEGLAEGEKIGRAEGAKSASIAIARSLKAKGLMSNADIAELTGLSPDDVSNL